MTRGTWVGWQVTLTASLGLVLEGKVFFYTRLEDIAKRPCLCFKGPIRVKGTTSFYVGQKDKIAGGSGLSEISRFIE